MLMSGDVKSRDSAVFAELPYQIHNLSQTAKPDILKTSASYLVIFVTVPYLQDTQYIATVPDPARLKLSPQGPKSYECCSPHPRVSRGFKEMLCLKHREDKPHPHPKTSDSLTAPDGRVC